MVKILMGLIAAIVIVAGGFFGFERCMQHRVAGEVEAGFAQLRASGGKASHGKVSFDLKSRTVTIADIVSETAAPSPVSVKIASITASGARQPDTARFAADTIEIADVEVGMTIAQPDGRVTYKAPRVTVKDYSGPAGWQQQPASSSLVDIYRSVIEQFAHTSATSVTIPTIAGTMNFGGTVPDGGDFTYSGLSMQGIKDGKIAAMKVDGVVFAVNTRQAGKVEKLSGDVTNIVVYDIDTAAAAVFLDPQKPMTTRIIAFTGISPPALMRSPPSKACVCVSTDSPSMMSGFGRRGFSSLRWRL